MYYDLMDLCTQVIRLNIDGMSFIPMNLLHNMPNLKSLAETFNAMEITARNYGWVNNAGAWSNPCLLLKAEFFWNGKDKGNMHSTIETLYLTFGKINQIAVEKDLFRYCHNSLKNIAGFLTQTHRPIREGLAQEIIAALYWGWYMRSEYQEWLNATTINLQDVLATRQFPNVTIAISAFNSVVQQTGNEYGFNGYYDPPLMGDSIPLDNTITAHFPNITKTPGSYNVWNFNTGFDGMLYTLRWNSSITPSADSTAALSNSPIWY